MKKHLPLILAALAFPAIAFANAGWPTLIIATLPLAEWYIGVVSVLMEAAVLWLFLRPHAGKALLLSVTANIVSLVAGFLLGGVGVGYLGQMPAANTPVLVGIFGTWHGSMVFMYVLTVLVEAWVIRMFWKYPRKKVWAPVLVMNILSYLVLEYQIFG